MTSYKKNKKIVLVGGCFDILHSGHIFFLEKAKKMGDELVIMLEADINITKNKGKRRPINTQKNRAYVLSKLKMVDKVIKLPKMENDDDYLQIIKKIKPNIIAMTKGDKNLIKKEFQAKQVGAKLIEVTKLIPNQSTSKIIEIVRNRQD